jgi:hypothetical protein
MNTAISPDSLSPDVRRVFRRLGQLGFDDRDSVWARIDRDAWSIDPLLAELNKGLPAGATSISRADLGNAVAELVRQDVAQLQTPRWPTYAFRLALVAFVIALWHPAGLFWRRPAPPQLLAARDIPPYHVIVKDDIKVVPATDNSVVAQQQTALYGRYTTRQIRQNAPFATDAHADAAKIPGLSERRVMTMRVVPPNANLSAALPAQVTVTAPASDHLAECADAWILSIVREATSATALATVALPAECTGDPLNALLAARAVTLVWNPRP